MENAPRRLLAEFVGAFALTFVGGGAILSAAIASTGLLGIGLAHGLAIGVMICAVGHVSGGHFNPAVSFAMLITQRMKANEFVGYVIAQLAGALVAALLLKGIFSDADLATATPALGEGFSVGSALLAEIVITFLLVFVIFGTAVDPSSAFKPVAGLAIGLTIAIDIVMAGPVSGAAINPGRWFGTAVVGGAFDNFWIWIVGPLVGAAIAALLYDTVIRPERD